ncbi:MAG: hypothetical protein IPI67_32200 [Myxococcales bacterium]|nr:hypothetical protein [Myxococcales bacterium]
MRPRWFGSLTCLLSACASAPPSLPPPRVTTTPVPSATAEPEAPPSVSEPEPPIPEVREPTSVGCRLASGEWSFDQLRLRTGGPVFAKVRAAPSTVVLPVTDKAVAATAVFNDGHVTLRAVVDSAELSLHPRAQTKKRPPAVLLGVVFPRAEAKLTWVATATDRASVSLDASAVVASPSPVIDQLFCDQLGLEFDEFDARTYVTKKAKLPKLWVSRDGAPIRRNLTAKPSAELEQGVEVEVLEVRGSMTHIMHDTPLFVVAGWVSSSDLGTQTWAGVGYGGYGAGYGRSFSTVRGDSCAKDLSLIVQLGAERVRVGKLNAGSAFRRVDAPAEPPDPRARKPKPERFVPIELPQQRWLTLVPEAKIVVERAELERCKE